jgi:hypothetical protein
MPRKKSKNADIAPPEPGASILEAKLEVGGKRAPRSSTRTNRTVSKITGKQGLTGRTKAARKSTPASTAELTAPDQTSEKTVAEAAPASQPPPTAETSIRERIALLAYFYWQTRGCQGGSPEEDWFRAERELLENLGFRSDGS